jgi:hypothetical protein
MVARLEIPSGSTILRAELRSTDGLFLWILVNTEKPPVTRHFKVYGTGWPISDAIDSQYIGTVFSPNGTVWHLFEETGA